MYMKNDEIVGKCFVYNLYNCRSQSYTLREKCPSAEFFSGPYFPVFGLNSRIPVFVFEKIRTRKNSVLLRITHTVTTVDLEVFSREIFQRKPFFSYTANL